MDPLEWVSGHGPWLNTREEVQHDDATEWTIIVIEWLILSWQGAQLYFTSSRTRGCGRPTQSTSSPLHHPLCVRVLLSLQALVLSRECHCEFDLLLQFRRINLVIYLSIGLTIDRAEEVIGENHRNWRIISSTWWISEESPVRGEMTRMMVVHPTSECDWGFNYIPIEIKWTCSSSNQNAFGFL